MPWPPMYFVAECTTKSAPKSPGRSRYGVATVLSTTRGTPTSCAMSAMRRTSRTVASGFVIDSAKNSRVSGRAAARQPSKSSWSTNVTSMPKSASESSSRSIVPPYSCLAATTWCPREASARIAAAVAACPEATATAARPPSSFAMRSSSTSCVGLALRL